MSDDMSTPGEMTGERAEAPLSGIVYGRIVYWMAMIGMVIGIVGVVLHLSSPVSRVSSDQALTALWAGKSAAEIWGLSADSSGMGHWYLRELQTGNGLAMLGVALCCAASVFGLFGACAAMLTKRGRERPLYILLGVIVFLLLSLSVVGVVSG